MTDTTERLPAPFCAGDRVVYLPAGDSALVEEVITVRSVVPLDGGHATDWMLTKMSQGAARFAPVAEFVLAPVIEGMGVSRDL